MISYLMNLFFGKPKQKQLTQPEKQLSGINVDELMDRCYRDNNKDVYINSLIAKISELEKENQELKDKLENIKPSMKVTFFDKIKIQKIEEHGNKIHLYHTMGQNVKCKMIYDKLEDIPDNFKVGNTIEIWSRNK